MAQRWNMFTGTARRALGCWGWPHWVQIRAAVSLGCVRMLNSHILQLFEAVDVGTRLEIRS